MIISNIYIYILDSFISDYDRRGYDHYNISYWCT